MQKLVEDFISKYQLQTDEHTRYIDLVSEIGELGKEIAKNTDYGRATFMKSSQITDEVGDCLFSLLALCFELNIDAKDALCNALSKYELRFTDKGDIGSGK